MRRVGCDSERPGKKMPLKFSKMANAVFTASVIGLDVVPSSEAEASTPAQ